MPPKSPQTDTGGRSWLFSWKNLIVFACQKPPLFFGYSRIPGPLKILHDLLHIPFFTIIGTLLNRPVFSLVKQSVLKNNDLYQKSWRGLALFPLENSRQGSDLTTPSSERGSRETVGPVHYPLKLWYR
jgi:hypothetical protein